MLKKNVKIYYFSGTGNTKKLVDHFNEVLIKSGYKVDLFALEEVKNISIEYNTTIGLAFPVAIQSTFPIVWDFVNKLPSVEGTDVFMFDTMEAFSGGIIGPLKKVLTQKGYNCIGAKEFKMSSSLNTKLSKVNNGKLKNTQALKEIEKYADELIQGKAKWKRVLVFSDLIRLISKSKNIWVKTSSNLSITDKCIKCLVCVNNCPVSAINLENDRIKIDNTKCNACIRCVSNCPQQAILIKGKKIHLS